MKSVFWLFMVIVISSMLMVTSAFAQRKADSLWTDPRSAAAMVMYSAPDFGLIVKVFEAKNYLTITLVKPTGDVSNTILTLPIQGGSYNDYREAIFSRPLPGIRQYGSNPEEESSRIVIQSVPVTTFSLPLLQPIDFFKRFNSPRQ